MRKLTFFLLQIEQALCRSTASRLMVWLAFFSVACVVNQTSLDAKLPRLDEILYLHQGKTLVDTGEMPPLCANPLPTFVNGILYVPLRQQSNALARVSTLRRYLALAAILAGTWYAGSCMAGCRGAFMATLLVSTLPYTRFTLINSTDALYCVSIMVALGPMVTVFLRGKATNKKTFFLIGGCLAAAVLSRSDGVIVTAAWFILVAVLIWLKSLSPSRNFSQLCAAFALFAFLVASYCCIVGARTGDFRTGLSERTFCAFLQGENVLYTGRFLDTAATKLAGGEDYGTYEQNSGSVITAIAHHRSAFANRLRRIPANFISACISAWGGYLLSLFACLLTIIGLIASLKSLNWQVPLISTIIFSPLVLYPLTFYRPGYIAMNIPAFCVLVVGTIYSWRPTLSQTFNMCFTAFVLLGAVIAVAQAWRWNHLQNTNLRSVEDDQDFVQLLADGLPKGETVMSVDPSLLWNAGLEHDAENSYVDKMFSISHAFARIRSTSDLMAYMHDKHLHYVVVDASLQEYYPEFVQTVVQSSPSLRIFIRDPHVDRQVYRLSDPSSP